MCALQGMPGSVHRDAILSTPEYKQCLVECGKMTDLPQHTMRMKFTLWSEDEDTHKGVRNSASAYV